MPQTLLSRSEHAEFITRLKLNAIWINTRTKKKIRIISFGFKGVKVQYLAAKRNYTSKILYEKFKHDFVEVYP